MPSPEFPEYAANYSKEARKTRNSLPPELHQFIEGIEAELLEDPSRHPERLIPASLDGKTCIYRHMNPEIEITFQVDDERKVVNFFHYSAPVFHPNQTIFISYAHNDRPWLDKLRAFLTVLEQQGVVKFWADTDLQAGESWQEKIQEALDSAKAGLLLVSQEFLASKFITETELPSLLDAAIQKGKKIYWLPLSPSTVFDTHKQITRYQSLLEDPHLSLEELKEPEQKRALVVISKRLAEAIAAR
jgi:hypothetical protein